MVKSHLDVDDVEGSRVPLAVDDGSDSTGVATSGDHAQVARLELDEVHDLAGVDVKAKRIVDLKRQRNSKLATYHPMNKTSQYV